MVSKKVILPLILLIMLSVFACGCFTATVHSTVNADGMISNYKMDLETSQFVYNMLKEQAKEDGYSSIQSQMLSQSSDSSSLKYTETWDGSTVTISMESTAMLESVDPEKLHIEKVDGVMVYTDSRLVSDDGMDDSNEYTESMLKTVGFHYYLTMPGKIIESNADFTDGNTAEWHLSGSDVFTTPISAKSEVPSFPIPTSGLLAIMGLIGAIGIIAYCKD